MVDLKRRPFQSSPPNSSVGSTQQHLMSKLSLFVTCGQNTTVIFCEMDLVIYFESTTMFWNVGETTLQWKGTNLVDFFHLNKWKAKLPVEPPLTSVTWVLKGTNRCSVTCWSIFQHTNIRCEDTCQHCLLVIDLVWNLFHDGTRTVTATTKMTSKMCSKTEWAHQFNKDIFTHKKQQAQMQIIQIGFYNKFSSHHFSCS